MYGSHSRHPSQPEWRLPPSSHPQQSWHFPPAVPPPHPTAAPPSYSAVGYGSVPPAAAPIPGAPMSGAGMNTAAWGVRYNQQQQQQQQQQHSFSPPPPLPPRLPSTTESSHYPYSPVTTPSPNKPLPAAPFTAPQPPAVNPAYVPQQTATPIPPPPPQFPPVYQHPPANNQTWQQPPHPVYSNLPPSHHYDPPSQPPTLPPPNQPSPATHLASDATSQSVNAQQTFQPPPPPVPPKTGATIATTGTSALGHGFPSDWEHLFPNPSHENDTEGFQPQRYNTPPVSTFESPVEHSPAVSSPASSSQVPHSTRPVSLPRIQTSNAESQPPVQRIASASPISPERSQEFQNPPRPVRVDSLGTNHSTVSSNDQSIDGVIDAWNRPISPGDRRSAGSRQSSHSFGGISPIQRKSPATQEIQVPPKQEQPDPQTTRPNTTTPVSASRADVQPKYQDLYEDLDPWFKSSLARYVAMLRKEAVADSDEERFKIFTAFVAKETKLREILYNMESAPKSEERAERVSTPAQQSPKKQLSITTPDESGLIPVEGEGSQRNSTDGEEDFEGANYSPGGRPILPTLHTPTTPIQRSTSHAAGRLQASKPSDSVGGSESQFSRSTSVPPSMGGPVQKQALEPLTTNPPQPIYTPFKYTEGPQRGSDNLAVDRPAYQAYSALRQASAESGRVMSNPSASTSGPRTSTMSPTPAPQNEHDETFIGLIRAKSVVYREKVPRKTSSPPPLPASLRHGGTDPIDVLRSMVSAPLAKQSESSLHVTTRKNLEGYTDDFSYIQETLSSWEANAKARREKLDKERMNRQEESEHGIDALFNEKEIGYADINTLEEEFRQTEARVQLDEERRELDHFIANVFDPLDKRLEEEISALQTNYDSALSQLDHENRKIKDSVTDKYNLSHTMKLVSEIYQKLETRYHKRLEIALDRERRRKKAERRPLVFMGDSPALKELDGDFERMEKRSIIDAARDRDTRANRLMDSFDDAIMHGLGENQSLLDEVTTKVHKLDPETIKSSSVPDTEIEQMLTSVFTMVESLRQDSESILRSFGIADSALNDADYSVSVAEARYSNSDADVFRQLADEKKKEDTKIQSELESKLESVRNGPAGITAKINELLGVLGKDLMKEDLEPFESITGNSNHTLLHPVDVLMAGPRPSTGMGVSGSGPGPKASDNSNPEHQGRMKKALEEAKRRNAARTRKLSQG